MTPAQSWRRQLAQWGEQTAAEYLSSRGYAILGRNVRTPHGELDLVARQGGCTVFVEVKTRASDRYGMPEEAVTPRKRQHLLDSAQAYLQLHPELGQSWRVDVIAIRRMSAQAEPELLHFENAFT